MPTFFDLLKYAATGIASPSMTYYDKMRASTLMGGVVKTLTGQPPLSFKSDGSPITVWSMKGNGSQSGTPSPQSIIMPTFCGVRTANLFDDAILQNNKGLSSNGSVIDQDGRVTTGSPIDVSNVSEVTLTYTGASVNFIYATFRGDVLVERVAGKSAGDVINTSNCDDLYICFYRLSALTKDNISGIMLNSGSTALPYEPFGWAEKITCAGQTTPVYLGEVPTVRRVKKLVLDGTEGWTITSNGVLRIGLSGQLRPSTPLCTHYLGSDATAWSNVPDKSVTVSISGYLAILDTTYTAAADFKAYLASEYAAGHPVTVWYVLANEQTGIVNEPLAKIGTYADELHSEDAGVSIPTIKGSNTLTVDTPIQPSEMTITFKG